MSTRKQQKSYMKQDMVWFGISAVLTVIFLIGISTYEQRTNAIGSMFQVSKFDGPLQIIQQGGGSAIPIPEGLTTEIPQQDPSQNSGPEETVEEGTE